MHTLYSENTGAFSLLQSIGEDKCLALQNQSYRFYIERDTLYLDILFFESKISRKTLIVEKNIKAHFDAHILDNNIHIIAAKKNYDLIYMLFDGQRFKKEKIYTFDADKGVPSDPVIKAHRREIYVVVSFISIKKPRTWSLYSYIKKDKTWRKRMIDKGRGLCYTQHCLDSVNDSKIYCLYKKYSNKSQNIMSALYDRNNLRWCRPKTVCKNGIDKYWPRIFANISGQIYFIWLEINEKINLCVAKKDANGDYNRLEIAATIHSITVCNDHYHIYAMSCERSSFFYDLCCVEQGTFDFINETSRLRRVFDLDAAKVKLFLDIKRELEQNIAQIEDDLKKVKKDNKTHTKKIQGLIEETINYQKELEEKEIRIDELTGVVKSLLSEKKLLERNLQKLDEKLEEKTQGNLEAEPEADPEAEDEAEDQAEDEADPEAEHEADPEAQHEAEDEAEPEAEPEVKPVEPSDKINGENAGEKHTERIDDVKYRKNSLLHRIKGRIEKLLKSIG